MIKICKICGTEFEAKSNRACYCSDECKKEGRKRKNYDTNKWNRLNPYKKNKWNREHSFESNKWNREHSFESNKWNREHSFESNKWNREHSFESNKWNREHSFESNKWNKSYKGRLYHIKRMRKIRKYNKLFCDGDIQLDNNGNPKLMMGTSDEKGLNKKQMNDRNEKFKNIFG